MEREQEWEGEESAPTLTLRTRKGKMVNLDAARVERTAETDRSVYLDRVEGIWKCRHCTWTYRMGSPGIDHAHNHEEYFRGLANAKTLSQQGSCFGSQSQQGIASTDENWGTKLSTVGFSAGEKNQGNGEADLETIEMDVERVLEEQDTHDLYCPNCNSCITKRVILRKRKRGGQDVQFESKRGKIEPVLQPDLNASTDTGPDVFRCLSCFSFFIPTAVDLQSSRFRPHYLDKITLNDCNTFTSPASETSMVAKDQNGTGMHRKDGLSKPQREGNNAFIPSIPGVSSPKGVQIDISKLEAAAKKTYLEDDAILPVVAGTATPAGPLSSQSNQTVPSAAAPGVLQDRETKIETVQRKFDGARTREWDILKSIVYGGLIESITSLGVVSSAAGSEAATLNIVALGLANLIGGLFVISQNLKELRNEQHSANDQSEQNLDRYQEILGQRENFWRHVVVAVFSYIIFGLIPPVIYGFSFRKTDNKEYKLIVVTAASLLCIALLAIGKAHVRKAPKTYIKTLLYYVGVGMLGSGLSYVVGQLIKKLLEKLGWFDSGAANPVSVFVETRSMRSRWASY